jgi:uncharacterized protein with FMN-binding domain
MKKLILSFFVVGSFTLYAVFYGSNSDTLGYVTVPTTTTQVKNKSIAIAKKQTIAITTSNGIYKDGEYTGDSVDAYYGNIQVKAVITNGALTDVIFLAYPQDRGNSIRVNNYAMPILKSEAIKAQSSNVNTVSGATDSSGAFKKSLASALAQAQT